MKTISKLFSRFGRKTWWITVTIFVLIVGGGITYQQINSASAQTTTGATLQTATARRGDLTIYASGTGTLIAHSDASFGFGTSGQVTKLNVKVGDQVQAGQTLAELSNTSLATLSYEQAKRDLAELTSAASIAAAARALANAQQAFEDAQNATDSISFPRASDTLIGNTQGAIVLAKQQLARASDAYRSLSGLPDGNARKAEALVAMTNAQLSLNTLIANYNWYSGTPTEIDATIARANLDTASAALQEAKWYVSALKGEQIPSDATGAALAGLQNAKAALLTAQETLTNTRLIAPISGTVMSLDFSVGDVVSSSATAVTISDLNQPSLEVFLDESDWASIRLDYKAKVVFDILPDKTFPAVVTQVDPGLDATSGTSVVRAIVQLTDVSMEDFNLPLGTSAAVDVIGGEATGVILIPVEALHDAGPGQYAVYVMENNAPHLRLVKIGIQDLTSVEITSGLNVGDVVTTGIAETE